MPILGGHHGGNELARKLEGMGIIPVITTATEIKGKASVESIARALQCRIVNRDSTKKVNIALLEKDVEVLCVKGPKILLVDDDVTVLKRNGLVVGIGANRGVSAEEVTEAVSSALSEVDAGIDDVKYFASAALKKDEKGIIEAAATFGKEVKFVPHEIINSVKAPTRSKAKTLGLNVFASLPRLPCLMKKNCCLKKGYTGMSLSRSQGKLYIVGIGPGGTEHLTKRRRKRSLALNTLSATARILTR